jgi:hypothetical protein
MSIRTAPWPAGVPCWADLSVPDVTAATAFYSRVLGWSFTAPDEEFGGYVIGSLQGAPAAGIGPQQQPGPAGWTLYFAAPDADSLAASVSEAGGRVLWGPEDVGPLGRMFVAADPSGAAFGVWQARQHIGAGIVNEPGGLSWDDLRSTEPDAARDFYVRVFGFRTEALDAAGPDYSMFFLPDDDAPLGGMGGMMGAPEGTPSHWVVYFGVEDVDAAVAVAAEAGGTVLGPPFDTPYGRMAALADPAGAAFWVVTPSTPQPERGD